MGCRVLAGKVYIRDKAVANQPLLFIGNAQATLNITEETQEQPDYTNPAGGNACEIRDISAVELALTMYDFDAANVALAVRGDANVVSADSVVAEAVMAFAGGAINSLEFIPTVGTVVVKVGMTTYVEDTDYTVEGGGFIVKNASALATAIGAGTGTPKHLAVTVDYDYASGTKVEALMQSGKTFEMLIDGKNRADNSAPEVWNIWEVQFGPVSGFAIITREFGSMELTATVLPDTTKPVDESQYFVVKS